MTRSIDPENIHLEVTDVVFGNRAVSIDWSSDIGWGQYTLYEEDKKLFGYSECMDKGDDKAFLREVLKKAAAFLEEKVEIAG